jgi:hypothetical protein
MTHIRTLSPKNEIERMGCFVVIFHREVLSSLNLPEKDYTFLYQKMCLIFTNLSFWGFSQENTDK